MGWPHHGFVEGPAGHAEGVSLNASLSTMLARVNADSTPFTLSFFINLGVFAID